jgi:hypothetical protein
LDEHGSVSFGDVERGLTARGLCPKLGSYWQFTGCGYRKSLQSCAKPLQIHQCPLPRHDLRNGGLSQSAYSLFLFFRNIAAGDVVGLLDRMLAGADEPRSALRRSVQNSRSTLSADLIAVYALRFSSAATAPASLSRSK